MNTAARILRIVIVDSNSSDGSDTDLALNHNQGHMFPSHNAAKA
jgi:hypothetical protein